LRELFQERFGSAGRGYAQPGEPWRTFRQEQMSYEMSDQWEAHLATEREIQPPLGAGGLRLVSDHEGAWLTRGTCREYCTGGTSMDGFAIHYLTQKEGGSFLVSVDGGRPTVVDTEGDTRDLGVFRRALDPGPHEIRIEVRGDGPVGIFGINTRDGVDGVEYASVGLNGATVSDWLATDDALVRKEVRRLSPDLFVFAFGTNEAYNLHHMRRDPNESFQSITRRMAEYQTRFTELIERYHSAAPGAACLVLLPPDMAPDGREDVSCEDRRVAGVRGEVCVPNTVRDLSGIVALQRAAARRAGCSVWSQSHAMGGEGSIAIWHAYEPPLAQPDGVHLTMDGYDTLAEALFTDLMRVYDIWRSGGYVPLETQPIPPASKILAGP
jgi:lysophospholipase L1-like esterase